MIEKLFNLDYHVIDDLKLGNKNSNRTISKKTSTLTLSSYKKDRSDRVVEKIVTNVYQSSLSLNKNVDNIKGSASPSPLREQGTDIKNLNSVESPSPSLSFIWSDNALTKSKFKYNITSDSNTELSPNSIESTFNFNKSVNDLDTMDQLNENIEDRVVRLVKSNPNLLERINNEIEMSNNKSFPTSTPTKGKKRC